MEYKFSKNKNIFFLGITDGIPIAMGYFAVSFSLGIMATKSGLSPFQGLVASFLNNASAGEYAGFSMTRLPSKYYESSDVLNF